MTAIVLHGWAAILAVLYLAAVVGLIVYTVTVLVRDWVRENELFRRELPDD